jgi:hypothetical protein
MKDTLRTVVAGAAGAVIASAIITGAPALADQVAKAAPKNSVTSKSIKNGQVKPKDLAPSVKTSLGKANSAVQSVASYTATQSGSLDITDDDTFTTVISKALPAGTYLVSAKAILSVDNDDNAQGTSQQCRLTNGTTSDVSQNGGATGTVFLFHRYIGTVNMTLPVTGPATVSLQCKNDLNSPPSGYALGVSGGRISAIQTTANN